MVAGTGCQQILRGYPIQVREKNIFMTLLALKYDNLSENFPSTHFLLPPSHLPTSLTLLNKIIKQNKYPIFSINIKKKFIC